MKLRGEGFAVGRKQVQRLRRAEGLRVPPPRKRQVRCGASTGLPTQADHRGHVWTWDFIADATVHGGALRMLTVLDEYTKEVHVLRPERPIGSHDVIALVQAAIAAHDAPQFIRSDNGPEFIAKDLQRWLAEQNIKTIYITPASPWENGFVESFHSYIVSLALPRRVPQPRAAADALRGARRHRRLPPGIQRPAPAQIAGLSLAATLRRETPFKPRLRAGPPTRSVPPPGIANHHRSHHIHQPRGLTFHLAQFLGSAQ